jgi:diguanylate cyclase (GGDEF)-like protein
MKKTDEKTVLLVVDDDPMVQFLAEESLQSCGFEIHVAGNGEDALRQFQTCRAQLVLMDVMMPGMNGFDCCRKLRALPGGENVPVLLMTGMDDVNSIEQAYEVGATDFAIKPINWLILEHRIRYVLRACELVKDLQQSEARLEHAQRIAQLGSWEYTPQTNRLWGSREFYRILELEGDETTLCAFKKVLPRVVNPDRNKLFGELRKILSGEHCHFEFEFAMLRGDQQVRKLSILGRVRKDRNMLRISGTIHDITEQRLLEQTLRENEARQTYLANHDPLTGLPNRLMFHSRLEHALGLAARQKRKAALMFLDLNNFKSINDSLGHEAGDKVLIEVAERLRKVLRQTDTVARLGGDEFVVLLEQNDTLKQASIVAEKIINHFQMPLQVQNQDIKLSTSLGIAIYPNDSADADGLMHCADVAMYRAKKTGLRRYFFYNEIAQQDEVKRIIEPAELVSALAEGQFELLFQPIIDMQNNGWVGAKARLHWNHPKHGALKKKDFYPQVERSLEMETVERWMLEQVMAKLPTLVGSDRLEYVAIDISMRRFYQQELLDRVITASKGGEVARYQLQFDVREEILMVDVERASQRVHSLWRNGIHVALADFGAGSSCLGKLKDLPLRALKIDQSYIQQLEQSPTSLKLCEAIIAAGHCLGFDVVAQGIETTAQCELLRDAGCQRAEGDALVAELTGDALIAELTTRMKRVNENR